MTWSGDAPVVLLLAVVALAAVNAVGISATLRRRRGAPLGGPDPNLFAELHQALDRDEFVVYYQPQVRLSDQQVVGAEALVRWRHPTRGLLDPSEFIAHAEASGLIGRLTRRVLAIACTDAARWRAAGAPASVAVNLSPTSLGDRRLAGDIAALLETSGLPPSALGLELTESSLIVDDNRSATFLRTLSRLGVVISIDDFGTGYSSLSRVANMPVNELKIDRQFVAALDERRNAAVVRATVELGHTLGLCVVAEGVETAEQARTLVDMGCDHGQGYWWARPMPVDAFEEMVGAADQDDPVTAAVYELADRMPVVEAVTRRRRVVDAVRSVVADVGAVPLAAVSAAFALYVAWTFLRWGGHQELIGDSVFALFNGFAVLACFRASRRTTGGAARGWWFLAIATGAYLLGDVVQFVREVLLHSDVNPAPDDILYLSMCPLALIGLFSFPVARVRSRRELVQLVLDVGTIAVAGGAAIWFIVLGDTVRAGGELLQYVVSMMYPIGDMVLVFGVTAALMRGVAPAYQRQLRWLTAGMVIMVITDLFYGWLALHASYVGGDAVDLGWAAAMVVIGCGALSAMRGDARVEVAHPDDRAVQRVNVLPYMSIAAAWVMLIVAAVGAGVPMYPLGGLLVAAGLLTTLVAVRELLGTREHIRLVGRYSALARTDPLTGLANRRRLMELGERMYERCRRDEGVISVLMIDIDHFKLINDGRGHAVGDAVLEHVAALCNVHVRTSDLVGRYGGDELIILMPGIDSPTAMEVAERLNEAARVSTALDVHVTLSIGVADSRGSTSLSSIMRDADTALYETKQEGRDGARRYRRPALAANA